MGTMAQERAAQETMTQALAEDAAVNDPANWIFENEKLEALFQRALTAYRGTHQVRGEGKRAMIRMDRRNPQMVELFGGSQWVMDEEFVRALRRFFYEEWTSVIKPSRSGAEDSRPPATRRYDKWSAAEDIANLRELDEREFDRIE